MGKKNVEEESRSYVEECENHANTQDNCANINITVNIGGKEFTMAEAEEIYLKLKELFEVTVVGNYPIYPYYPILNIWPDWTNPSKVYCGGTADEPPITWGVINICNTESEE